MANISTIQKLVDSPKKSVILLTTRFDGSGQETNVMKVDASTLAYAANANSLLMVSNTHPRTCYRNTIYKIQYNVKGASVQLKWDGQGNEYDPTIAVLGPGADTIEQTINNPNTPTTMAPASANSNGDIYISTTGAAANDSYSILLELHKNLFDYYQANPNVAS